MSEEYDVKNGAIDPQQKTDVVSYMFWQIDFEFIPNKIWVSMRYGEKTFAIGLKSKHPLIQKTYGHFCSA